VRLALSVGHGSKWKDGQTVPDPGAVHIQTGVTEYDTCRRIARCLEVLLGEYRPLHVLWAPSGVPLQQRVQTIQQAHATFNVDLAVEIHLNGFNDPLVDGCEALIPDVSREGDRGVEAASRLQDSLCAAIGRRNRGVKPRDDLYFLTKLSPLMSAIMVEPFFITNDNSAAEVIDGDLVQRTAYGLFRGILAWLG